jgi:hypothetical protein
MDSPPLDPVRNLWRAVLLPGIVVSAVLLALYLATVTWQLPFPRDLHGYVLGRDFLNFWAYGREVWSAEAGRFYDITQYNGALAALVGHDYPTQQWSYPPHLMLLMAPFGLLGYLPAYLLWTALGVAALWWAATQGMARSRSIAGLLLAPAGLVCLVSGQNAFFAAALLVAVFRFMDARPLAAGILLGLLTVKPQLGMLFPLMLLMTGRWRVFAAAGVTTLALAAATAAIWGTDIWTTYLAEAVPLQEYVIRDPTRTTMGFMPTAYMNARLVGLSADAAYWLQTGVAALAVAAVVWTFRRRRDPLLSYALLVTAGLTATPYLMSYDLVVVVWLMLALAAAGQALPRPLLLAVHFLPFLAIAGEVFGLPGSALVLPIFGMILLKNLASPVAYSHPCEAKVPSLYEPQPAGRP